MIRQYIQIAQKPDSYLFNSDVSWTYSLPSGVSYSIPNSSVQSSGGSFSQTFPSVSTYSIPDVNWTDSDGSTYSTEYSQEIVCTSTRDLLIDILVETGDDTSEFTINSNGVGDIDTLDAGGLSISDLQVNSSSVNVPFTLALNDVVTIIYTAAVSDTNITLTGTY